MTEAKRRRKAMVPIIPYFIDFTFAPVIIVLLGAVSFARVAAGVAVVAWLLGLILWTFAEYWFHRYLLHEVKAFRAAHHFHHLNPEDLKGFGIVWMAVPTIVLLWAIIAAVAGVGIASAAMSGFAAGYLAYVTVHVRLHLGETSRFGAVMAALERHHEGHHRVAAKNFGVTNRFWDIVFGTIA